MDIFSIFRKPRKEIVQESTHQFSEISDTMIPQRVERVPAYGLTSVYKKKRPPGRRWGVKVFKDGANITRDMFDALIRLDTEVRTHGGKFYIIGLFRSWEMQAKARRKFETGEKKDFVAKPGGSFHNAGRAVDIAVKELNFAGVNKKDWLEVLWALARPLGFEPIIKIPDIDASEAWHFDFPGRDWKDAYRSLPYPRVAKCAILDVGCWNKNVKKMKMMRMFVQAQLIRLGYHSVGKVDGVFGPKTKEGLNIIGHDNMGIVDICNSIITL